RKPRDADVVFPRARAGARRRAGAMALKPVAIPEPGLLLVGREPAQPARDGILGLLGAAVERERAPSTTASEALDPRGASGGASARAHADRREIRSRNRRAPLQPRDRLVGGGLGRRDERIRDHGAGGGGLHIRVLRLLDRDRVWSRGDLEGLGSWSGFLPRGLRRRRRGFGFGLLELHPADLEESLLLGRGRRGRPGAQEGPDQDDVK